MSEQSRNPGRTPLPVLRLTAVPAGATEASTGRLQFTVGGQPMILDLTVPSGETPLRALLPIFQGLTNAVVDVAVQKVEHKGKSISCQAGCGACCRQLVPVSAAEAHALARLVDAMPEPRRSIVQSRFADARERLAAAGLLEELRQPHQMDATQRRSLGLQYARLGVACPFLEEESCSIHPDRPLACREYLVTSPAEACGRLDFNVIETVPLPTEVANAVRAVDWQASAAADGWVPLALALDWAADHPTEPSQPGTIWLERVFTQLARRPVSASEQKPEEAAITQVIHALFDNQQAADRCAALFLRPDLSLVHCGKAGIATISTEHWPTQRPIGRVDILRIDLLTATMGLAYVTCQDGQARTRAVLTLHADAGTWKVAALVLESE